MKTKNRFSLVLLIVYGLILVGLVFLAISSLSEAQTTFNDKYYFIKKQSIWVATGTIVMFLTSRLGLNWFRKLSPYLYLLSIIGLVIVLLPEFSNTIFGARRWLSFGGFAFQPSELYKFTAIVYFSHLFSQTRTRNLKNLLINLLPPLILIILEPNMSSAVLITTIVFSLYYLAGGEIIQLFSLSLLAAIISIALVFVSPYRSARLQSLINPQDNTTSTSYHTNQIILSLSSGGLFGKGFANSSQKYNYLPQLATDSILAVIGEETGFVGVTTIIIAYIILTNAIFKVAKLATDPFLQLSTAGFGCWIAFQSLTNLATIVAIIPLTGIPLPFISYGGSSLIMLLSAIGWVHNTERIYGH